MSGKSKFFTYIKENIVNILIFFSVLLIVGGLSLIIVSVYLSFKGNTIDLVLVTSGGALAAIGSIIMYLTLHRTDNQ